MNLVMKMLFPILLYAGTASCQSEAHWVLLPVSEAAAATRQCSRGAPKPEAGWGPSAAEVAALEKNLWRIAALQGGDATHNAHVAYPENYYRQYVGIVVAGHRFIYINAGTEPLVGLYHQRAAIVCDGGTRFWGALYDPSSGLFSDLQLNGPYGP